jgi:hypothetical protein
MASKITVGEPFTNLIGKKDGFESGEEDDIIGVIPKTTDADGHIIGWRNKSIKKEATRNSLVLNRHGIFFFFPFKMY